MSEKSTRSGFSPIFIIGALFFIFGFVTWLNSVLIPYLKIACELTIFEAYLVTFAFYISFFVMAMPSGLVIKAIGFKNGMSFGLLIMALGAMVFIPAALNRAYWMFLAGLFLQGTGLTLLQAASNPYITILGPIESAARRISIMGICNKVAGALAPIILGAITLANADNFQKSLTTMTAVEKAVKLDELAARVIMPYVIIIVVLMLLAFLIYRSNLPEVEAKEDDAAPFGDSSKKSSVFSYPHLLLGLLTLFLYVGAEVIAGDTIIAYGSSLGIAFTTAKFFTTCTMIGMVAGYIIGIVCIPRFFSQQFALKASAVLGILFTIAAIVTKGYFSILFIALLGLANALVWPAIWPLAIAGLGRHTKAGGSLLVAGIAGGAVMPLVYALLTKEYGEQQAYWILIPCYLSILYYAIKGHKLR